VKLGEATVKVHGDVGRCAITTLDPESGEPTVDTLKALASYRKDGVKEPLPLGVYASVVEPGRVRVGDDIAISLY
jgi:MOSC domain-containing protein